MGEGAIRVTTGRSDIEVERPAETGAPDGAAAPLSTPGKARPSLAVTTTWLGEQIERQAERWSLWTPVAMGLGAGLYFTLSREPQAWVALAMLPVAAVLAIAATRWSRGRAMTAVLVLIAFGLAGFALAKLRTESVKAPVAGASGRPERLEGWVVDVWSPGAGGQRLLIAPARIGDWAPPATPARVRVTLRGGYLPGPGEPISLLAVINTPPPPASPGAYDFARDAYFESVGGVGFALGPASTWEAPVVPPWRLRATMQINAWRWALTRRIVDTLGMRTGGLAAAMTTGHEAFIPKAEVDDLRVAGLAHIISISGLHMAIVGGFVFAIVRFGVAAWPWLALRIHGKKLAAGLALAAVLAYLVLSGWPPPAERSAITASVAFGAILVDRQAISLRALAIAAILVMLLQPEAVTQPGFQMSFAATAGLVALAELWPRPVRERSTSPGRSASCRGCGPGSRPARRRASWRAWPQRPSPCSTSTGSRPGGWSPTWSQSRSPAS